MLIPLAVELVKVADIQDLEFSQAFETIYATLENLRKEEENQGESQITLPISVGNGRVKKKKYRKITCKICGKKLRSLAGKHLVTHGLTLAKYKEISQLPVRGKDQISG